MKMNYDKILTNILFDIKSSGIIGGKIAKINRKYPNILSYITKRYCDSFSTKETLYRMKYNINIHPKCLICGKPTKFYGTKHILFTKHCSNKCTQNDEKTKYRFRQTCLERYGIEYVSKLNEFKEKTKQTCLKRYGVEHVAQSNDFKSKYKQTCLERYGVDNPLKLEKTKINSHSKRAKEKQIKTCLERYGVENSFQSEIVKNKYKENYKRKFGVENPFQNEVVKEKIKQTCLKKYGVDKPSKSDIVKEKYKQTCLERYGVSSPMKNQYISNKSINIRIKNNTWSSSKPEEELYLCIKERFPLVKRQYKDKERYPWFCDFYIPELDLFLELNGTWTHGKHPFNMNSKEDNSILNLWKEKSKEHPMYLSAIKTWTISDVNKRNKAKENNLNFKEVWTLLEGKEFIYKLSNKKYL